MIGFVSDLVKVSKLLLKFTKLSLFKFHHSSTPQGSHYGLHKIIQNSYSSMFTHQ
jgi:hypothetical protein